MKKNPGARTRARRAAAFRSARARGLTGNSATRSALRKVPFTQNERRRGAKFQGSAARMLRNPLKRKRGEKKSAELPGEMAARQAEEQAAPRKRGQTAKQREASLRNIKKAQAASRKKAKAKKRKLKQYKKVPVTRKRKVTKVQRVKGTKRVRYRYGRYSRAKLTNPRTGKRQYSYMYRDKRGRLRKIPYHEIVGEGKGADKRHVRFTKARHKAAQRIIKRGGPFVANRRRNSRGRFVKNAAKSARKRKQIARKAAKARWKGHKRKGKKRKATKRKGAPRKGTKAARSAAAKKGARTRKRNLAKGTRKSPKRRKGKMTKAQRSAAAKKGWRKRKRAGGAKRRRKGKPKTRAIRIPRGNYYVSNRRRRGRRRPVRRRRRSARRSRRLTPNQMKSLFKKAMTKGALVAAGFLTHRLLTSLVCEHVVPMLKGNGNGAVTPPPNNGNNNGMEAFTMATMEKPLAGLAVLAIGVPLTAVTLGRGPNKDAAVCVGAGMVASFVQSLVVSVLHAAEQPKIASQFEGYSNSMAYALRGRRGMRGLRGYGGLGQMERRAKSIMPRYAPVGQFRQAAAGLGQGYRQAAAGTGRLGEYFQPTPVGEYFVPSSVQGVGQYEAAGPLAMQAAAGFGQAIDDGIRPDSNLDNVLDLAESAAGLRGGGVGRTGRGMGEYFTAVPGNGSMVEERVPTQSQWIPNGPLWAGTLSVKDTMVQSELPAGVLAGPGGNGILSGG
jgi:hypothetical protein